ncbi:molybdopterin-guanine dinucleotide biosynthesis protein B [Priestia megaterium NCT-2]|nr:molybdopterin-guanine dinucleotide biosynthesis protein B [Priestia megaterium NCT-2]
MALGEHCSIIQIVGYQNSGKTTLVEKLIAKAKQEGLRVASIKHHGHGGVPDNICSSKFKDSIRHYKAGAIVSSVEGDGVLQLSAKVDNWGLEKTLKLYELFSPQVIFIEGYKQEHYPKVVLIRSQNDLSLLRSLTNIKCVISHIKLDKEAVKKHRVFQLDEEKFYIDFLIEEVVKKMDQNLFKIVRDPISVEEVTNQVSRREVGAITLFIGTVREFTKGKRTLSLEYQAYDSMAVKMLSQIGKEIKNKWPDSWVAITHRIGKLEITDIAVVIAVSSPHRKTAYEANEYAIERIKQIVPIWKKEFWEDGTMWIGDQLEKNQYAEGRPSKGE